MNVSIDGFDKVNSYIRYPSKWENLKKNLKSIDKNPKAYNISLPKIHTVVQMYNVMNLTDLFEFLKKFKFIVPYPSFDFLVDHDHMKVHVLPKELKKIASDRLLNYADKVAKESFGCAGARNFTSSLTGIVDYIQMEDTSHLIPEFKRITRILDLRRNQKMTDYIPDLEPVYL